MAPKKAAKDKAVQPAEWSAEAAPLHRIDALLTHIDAVNTFPAAADVSLPPGAHQTLLELLPDAGGGPWCKEGYALESRVESNLSAIFEMRSHERWKHAPKLLALGFDLQSHYPSSEGKQGGKKLGPAKLAELKQLFDRHAEDFNARCVARLAAVASPPPAGFQGFDPGGALPIRLLPYPLTHKLAQEVWAEAQQEGQARAMERKVSPSGVPRADLVTATALLSTLAVRSTVDQAQLAHTQQAPKRPAAVKQPVVAVEIDRDDLVQLLRGLYDNPSGASSANPETAAPEVTLAPAEQALFLALFVLPNGWARRWYDKLSSPQQLTQLKEDHGVHPARRDGLHAFRTLADGPTEDDDDDGAADVERVAENLQRSKSASLEDVVVAIVAEIKKKPDLLQPLVVGVVVQSGTTFHEEDVHAHFMEVARMMGPTSADSLHVIVTRMGARLKETHANDKRSGFVENLAIESVAVPKDLPPATQALIVLLIQLLATHDHGDQGDIFKLLSKKARVGGDAGSGADVQQARAGASRSMSEEDKLFHTGQTEIITAAMPDKKVIEFGFRSAFGAAPTGPHAERLLKIGDQRAALVKMEKDLLEPVGGESSHLDPADLPQLSEIRKRKRDLIQEELKLTAPS